MKPLHPQHHAQPRRYFLSSQAVMAVLLGFGVLAIGNCFSQMGSLLQDKSPTCVNGSPAYTTNAPDAHNRGTSQS